MQLGDAKGAVGQVNAQRISAFAGHRIGQYSPATTNIHYNPARQGCQFIDPLQAQRIDLVQWTKFALRIPPPVGQVREFSQFCWIGVHSTGGGHKGLFSTIGKQLPW
jgi:hypothetical protein